MKQVRELSDSTAFVVLNKKREHVATVQFRYSSGGSVQCDVWGQHTIIHQKKAGGGGYDKAAAALAGAVIDGFKLSDHCGDVEPAGEAKRKKLRLKMEKACPLTEETRKKFQDEAKKIGCNFANWDHNKGGWGSLFFRAGLDRLTDMGYVLIRAL